MNKPRRKNVNNEKEFIPQTELGYLVKKGFIKSIDEIFDHSLSIKEYQIVNTLMGFKKLKEEVLDVSDVQKQCKAGQISSKKAVVVVGNEDGYIGVGTASAKEFADAVRKAAVKAKLNLFRVRRGQWQGEGQSVHTIAASGSGKSGAKTIKIIPAPIGTGNNYGRIPSTIFKLAGIKDVFIKSYGGSKVRENSIKALIEAIQNASSFCMPVDWDSKEKKLNPLILHSQYLMNFTPGNKL